MYSLVSSYFLKMLLKICCLTFADKKPLFQYFRLWQYLSFLCPSFDNLSSKKAYFSFFMTFIFSFLKNEIKLSLVVEDTHAMYHGHTTLTHNDVYPKENCYKFEFLSVLVILRFLQKKIGLFWLFGFECRVVVFHGCRTCWAFVIIVT